MISDETVESADQGEIVTLRDAANRCGVTIKAIRGRVDSGRLAHVKGADGQRRVKVGDLIAAGLLASTTSTPPGTSPLEVDQGSPAGVVTYAELYAERDQALRDALERAGAAEGIAEDRAARIVVLEAERDGWTVERIALGMQLASARAEVARLEAPESVLLELPAVTMIPAESRQWWRRMLG